MNISVVIGQPAEFECILKQRRDDLQKVELSPLAQTLSSMTIKSIFERGRGRGWVKSTNKRRDHFSCKAFGKKLVFWLLLLVLIFFHFERPLPHFFPIEINRQVFTNAAKDSTRSFHFAFPTRCSEGMLFYEKRYKLVHFCVIYRALSRDSVADVISH